jgi:glycosyltransferase involved in cell wall biosynthesis
LTSLFDGLTNVVCESMLYGCPIIASGISDIPELLGNNERGILFNPNLPDEICDAFDLFERMSLADRQKMIRVARKFAVHEFDQKTMVDKYLEVIQF